MFHKYRSSRAKVFCKTDAFKSFAKSTRKHLCRNLKRKWGAVWLKETQTLVIAVSFALLLRTSILKKFCEWVLTIIICFMKINNLSHKNKKRHQWIFVLAQTNLILFSRFIALCFHVICIDQSNFKFCSQTINSPYLYEPKHPPNLTCIHIDKIWSHGLVVKLNLWKDVRSSYSHLTSV